MLTVPDLLPRLRGFVATLGFVAALMALPTVAPAQTSGTWTNASGGTWSVSGNWDGGAIASGTGAVADFSTLNIVGTQTATLNTAYTLGSLLFGDTTTSSSGSWVISNGGSAANTITLNAGAGTPSITVSSMGSGSSTIGANLAGSQGFILNSSTTANPGTLVLSGSSSVSGNIVVNSGRLLLANTLSTAYQSGTFQLANGATLRVAAANQNFARPIVLTGGTATFGTDIIGSSQTTRIAFSNVISGSGGLTIDSTIGFEAGAANTYSGNTTITPTGWLLLRTLGIGSSGAPTSGPFGTGTVTLNGGGMRQYNGSTATIYNVVNVAADTSIGSGGQASDATIFAGPMTLVGGTRTFTVAGSSMQYSGPGIGDGGNGYGLTKAGTGLLMLGGSNSYTGATTLTSGTLRLDNQNAVANSTFAHSGTGSLIFNSTVSGNAFTFGGLAASSTTASVSLQNNAGTPAAITLTVGGNNATTSYAGSLTGAGSFVKVGSGILSLSGSNAYAGTMTVNGGVLSVSSSNALPGWGTAGRVVVGANGTLAVGNDMTLQQAIDAGYLAATSGVGFDTTAGGRTVNDVITGSRPFVKTGANVLTLTGANTFVGPTTLAGGTVELGVAQDGATSGPLGASGEITFAGGGLRYTSANQHDYSSRFSTAAGQTYRADTNGQNVTWAADLASAGGALVKTGAGQLSLTGSNSYTGTTTVSAGTLAVATANSLPGTTTSGRYSVAAGTTLATGTAFADATLEAMLGTGNFAVNSVLGVDTAAGNRTFASSLSGTVGLSVTGGNRLTLSGSNRLGAIAVTNATLTVSNTNGLLGSGAVTVDGGTIEWNPGVTENYSFNSRSIAVTGSGATFRGVNPGLLTFGNLSGTGAVIFASGSGTLVTNANTYSGGTIIKPGAVVAYTLDGGFGSGPLTIEGGRLRSTTTANRTVANATTLAGNPDFYSSSSGNDRDLVFTGPITIAGATRTVTVDISPAAGSAGIFFNGPIGDGGAGLGLVKTGTSMLILGGANTFSGTTTIAAGTLRLDNASALGGGGNLSFTGGTLLYTGSNTVDYAARVRESTGAIGIDTNGQTVTWAGTVDSTNVGGLAKSGSGTLVLGGNNAYTGATTVSGGTLQLGNGGTAGSITGNVTLSSTSGLVFNRSDSFGYSGSISGTGSITKLGAGTLSLSGNNVITGVTTIAGGTLSITGTGALPGIFTLDGGTLVNATGASSFGKGMGAFTVGPGGGAIRSDVRIDPGSTISGTSPTALLTYGPVTTGSTGIVLVISGNNTYAANTKVEAGMAVVVDSNNAFGTGTLELAGAAVRSRSSTPRSLANAVTISAHTQFFGAAGEPNLTFTGPTLLSGGSRTLQVDNVITSGSSAGQPGVIFTNVISDGGNGYGITKTGIGVLALGGANTFSGATTLTAGTLQLQNQNALQHSTLALSGTGGVIFDAAVAANAFTLGGLSGANAAATLALQNSAATAITLTVGGNGEGTSYAGSLTGAGSLEKIGGGSLVLAGPNTFAGPTTITAGTLQIGGGGTAGSLGGNVVNNAALVFNRSDASSYGGGISGSGSLTKAGAGTLTLSGSNDYAGPTTLAGGMLALAGANSLPSSGDVAFTGGSLQYSGAYTADLSARIIGSSGAVAIDTNGQAVTFATGLAASNVGGLRKSGAGTLTLSAANAFTGPVTLAGGVLAVDNADSLPGSGAVTFTGGTLRYSASYLSDLSSRIVSSTGAIAIDTNGEHVTFAAAIGNTNTAGLTKSGAGTLTLSGSNTYGGTTTATAGTLAFTTAAALSSGSIALDGATLAYTGTSAGGENVNQAISLGAGGGTLRNSGANAAILFLFGNVSGAGPLTVASGTGLVVFSGANTNSGGVTLQAGSQIVVGADAAGPAGSPTSGAFGTGNLVLAGGGLRARTGAAGTVGNAVSATADTTFISAGSNTDKSLTFTGPVTLSGGSRTFTVNISGTGSPAAIFSGAIGDGGNAFGLTKAGPGTMILAGVNTYTGPTTASAGLLLVNGTQAGGAVQVDAGATLGGSGVIGGAVNVLGTLSPGNSPGVLSVDSLTLGAASTSLFEIDGTTRGTQYDGVDITGVSGPTYGGTLSLVFANGSAFGNTDVFDLFSFSGSPTGDFSTVTSTGFYAGTWSPVASGTWKLESGSQTLTFSQSTGDIVVVPEPAAVALAAIGIAAAAWARRRS